MVPETLSIFFIPLKLSILHELRSWYLGKSYFLIQKCVSPFPLYTCSHLALFYTFLKTQNKHLSCKVSLIAKKLLIMSTYLPVPKLRLKL